MGEIAEMMLNGGLCIECGCAIAEKCIADGVPVRCHDCHTEHKSRCDKPVEGVFCEDFYIIDSKRVKHPLRKIERKDNQFPPAN